METRQIRNTTIDILLVEQPSPESKQSGALPTEVPGAGGGAGNANGRSTHQLALGYRVALGCADEKNLESMAFQGIDTRTCGCPLQEAATAAVGAVKEYLDTHKHTSIRRILFVEYSQEAYDVFRRALKELPD